MKPNPKDLNITKLLLSKNGRNRKYADLERLMTFNGDTIAAAADEPGAYLLLKAVLDVLEVSDCFFILFFLMEAGLRLGLGRQYRGVCGCLPINLPHLRDPCVVFSL